MSQPVTADDITGKGHRLEPLLPVCPHCGADPAEVAGVIIRLGGNLAAVFLCANPACRKIHSVAPIPNPKPRSSLVVPSGRM